MTTEKIFLRPNTIEEAIHAAHEHAESFAYLAGGTDIIVNKFQGNDDSECLIDITGINELKKVFVEGDFLKIGSLVRLDDLKNHPIITDNFPALLQAANAVASPMLRKTATLGGNILCENRCSFYNQSEWWREAVGYCLKCDGDICIATGGKKACFSKFVSDTAPVLISMNAQLEVCDLNNIAIVPLESIYTGDGIISRNLPKTALIRYITIPSGQNYRTVFKKLRPREAVDFTSLTTAVSLSATNKLKIVIGGVDPKPIVFEGNPEGNKEEYIKTALKKCRIVDNDYYTRVYRREMIRVFLEQSFEELIN